MSREPILNRQVERDLEEIRGSGLLDYRSEALPTWCPGCGYFAITHGMLQALSRLKIPRENLLTVSGIGCAGRYPFFLGGYGLHSLHGRALPVACGAKMASPDLTVIAVGGDGDGLGIGSGHLPHVIRRNPDITYVLFDNGIYGLTKGQSSPTTPRGQVTGTHPYGNPDEPLDPVLLGLTYGASMVALGSAADPDQIRELMVQALEHRGFSFVIILTPCLTFDKVNISYDGLRDEKRVLPASYDPSDRRAAFDLVLSGPAPYGVIYREDRPTWTDRALETAGKARG